MPDGPHRQIDTILGIGKLTAAAIVATAIDIDRFETADHLVGYYGVFPEEFSSGVDKFGRPQPPGKKRMCRKGNGERHRSFSVNLDKQAFRCFYPAWDAHGNVLDLWAAVRGLSLREAGLDMTDTFHLPPASPRTREEEPVKEPVCKPPQRSAKREAKTARKKG